MDGRDILIVGAGVGGLAAALALHARGVPCRVVEAAPEIRPLGVGINVLPHATGVLARLGVLPALEAVAMATREAAYFNRFGQLIHREPLGRFAGNPTPQISIHRGELQRVLLEAARERLGEDRLVTGWKVAGFEGDGDGVTLRAEGGATLRGAALVAADGIHSVVRRALFPGEPPFLYSGVNMWRGTTRMPPILSGATMVRAGWLSHGKMVVYPIRDFGDGTVEMNWVAEIETPRHLANDWARPGSLDDFLPAFEDWRFDWLDVPAMIRGAAQVLEYPMVDKDPLPRWTHGRVTLLGDAAHPMVPRGSNGAGQAILDAAALAECLGGAAGTDAGAALREYEARRREATAAVVRTNRTTPPDAIIREVHERTGDRPFGRIEDVIAPEELGAMLESYRRVAGYDAAALARG